MHESIHIQPWSLPLPPQRILVIRMEALGDLFFTFPVVQALRRQYPDATIDLLTRSDYAQLPPSLGLFSTVYSVGGKSSLAKFPGLMKIVPRLMLNRYDVVLDLQRNRLTRALRRSLFPSAWTEFDRFSPNSALRRNVWSVQQVFPEIVAPDFSFAQKINPTSEDEILLLENGYKNGKPLVLLNPAGFFETRNWPIEYYQRFMELWLSENPNTQFLFLGLPVLQEKVNQIRAKFPNQVIDLVGKTSIAQAYRLVLKSDFMLTEDSGLGHFSWLSGKKTLMLLGATRSDWTSPYGAHTASFNSDDLPCGNCMRSTCIHATVLCMNRLSAEMVFEKASTLYNER